MTAKLRHLLAACLLVLASSAALAQYPSRAIKVIVPIPPGGAPDIAARVIGQKLSEILAVPVVVDNHAGSNGNIAGDLVAKSPPDGYTLLLGQDSLVAINPHLYAKMPFDPLKDLAPVATLVANQFVLAVNPSLPVKNFQEFIEYARRTTPPLPYASGGNGSQHHLSMEILKQRAGIDMLHVPFKGGRAGDDGDRRRRHGGDVRRHVERPPRSRPASCVRWRSRVSSARRSTPTCRRSPSSIRATKSRSGSRCLRRRARRNAVLVPLRAAIEKALAAPDVRQKLNSAGGVEPFVTTPDEFAALIRRDYDKYGKIVKTIGIKLD